jgi:selenocysteine lyase/cysteine desulfurase
MNSYAIANVGVEGIEPQELAKNLMQKHKVWTVAIDRPNVRGCRITPNLYSSEEDLDQLLKALKSIAKKR